jgi:hypothetical protein
MDRVRRVSLELCAPADRQGVRFTGPRRRRFSERITVENLESVDLGQLCARLRPAIVFLRLCSGDDQALGSRIDVYVPRGAALYAVALSRLLYAVSAVSLALALAILMSGT